MRKWTGILIWLICPTLSAQTVHHVSVRVVDQQGRDISVGDALLLENDSLIKYVPITDGKFLMQSILEGNYLLRISSLGFEILERNLIVDKNLSLDILLKESTTNLEEVEVVAAKPIFTNTKGNLKIDVTNSVFTSIPDPMDLLSKLPGIQVSPDRESMSILGKGAPLIYVGNQRITLEEFSGLSVDDIANIEIVKNPSSKYEANGRAVLLVTRKISDTEGVKLEFSETLSFKQNFNNVHGLNGSFKRKKLILKSNFTYNDLQTWESQTFAFEIPERDIFTDYLFLIDQNERAQINTGAGVLYQLSKTDYFSLDVNAKLQSNDFPINTETFLRQQAREDFIVTESLNDNSRDFVSGNFNYNSKLTPKLSLFTGLQYSSFVQKIDSNISNNTNKEGFVKAQAQEQKYGIDVWAYRLDMENEFDNGLKLELGANISDARADASSDSQFFSPDRKSTLDYDYSESTYATYTQISGILNENISFSAGLRVENNRVNGKTDTDSSSLNTVSLDTNPLIDRQNTRLFPKALITFKIDSVKSMTVNYSKSIERPDYSRATSIQVFINPFLVGSGNVNLLPTVTEEVSANFQVKQKAISVNYSRRKNPMFFTIGYKYGAENAVFALRNLEAESGLDISLTLPVSKGLWTATHSAMLSTRRVKDSTAETTAPTPFLYVYSDHQFKITKDTTISLGGWGYTKSSEGIFKRNGLISLNAAISKTFFDKLHCTLRFNDITKAQNFEESYSIDGVNATGTYFADAQEIALSIKCSLGKIKEPDYKNKDVDENLNRID